MTTKTMKEISQEVTGIKEQSMFDKLNAIDVNGHTEEKNGLTYLSWAWAWSELKKQYPTAQYTIERFGEDRKPYLYDEDLGYMVFTSMTIDGLTHEMWLPVMDGANKAMKNKPYKYKGYKYVKGKKVWNKQTNGWEIEDKIVEPATMFDINKTIMRCLVKNISMFGLGLYIYAGEDLPESLIEEEPKEIEPKKEQKPQMNIDQEISVRCQKLISLGVDFGAQGTKDFIAKHMNGKFDVTKMSEEEKMTYIKVLNSMIKKKEKDNAK